MTAAYPDAITIEFYNGAAWVDLSSYVVDDIRITGGLGGWQPDKRVAILGTLDLTLNNKAKLFSPMGGDTLRGLNTLSGFTKGAPIRIKVTYLTIVYVIWAGRIASIDSDDKNFGDERARLMAVDWIDQASKFPMKGATIATDKTFDEALTLLLARMSVQPEATDFDAGTFAFSAVFDNVKARSMAISELTKLAFSELGYIYLKPDGTLRAENANARVGTRALDTITIASTPGAILAEDGTFLLDEDGFHLLDESGGGTPAAIELYNDPEAVNILLDTGGVMNRAVVRAYPVATDASLKVLYSLGTPLYIAPSRSISFSAHYTDPNGLGQISGTNMQTPAATTDYLANQYENGTGTNHTADVTVSATYYGDLVEYTIANASGYGVWITKLQARGYGIYYGNSIESTVEDTDSQDAYGLSAFSFDQRYQRDPYFGAAYAASAIEEYRTPKSRITKMRYLANLNSNHMLAFLALAVGSLIMVTEDRSAISNHYYITDREAVIKQGGIISVEYGLKQNDSYLSGALNPIVIEGSQGGTDGVNYGPQPRLSNLKKRTITAWVNLAGHTPGATSQAIVAYGSAYMPLYMLQSRKLYYYQAHQILSDFSFGIWETTSATVPASGWALVAITHDTDADPLADPIIYINATAAALTEDETPMNPPELEQGLEFVIGNRHSTDSNYDRPFGGKIFDARVYDRVLSSTEITTLYNGGTPDNTLVPDGMIFQGPAISDEIGDAASLAGTALSSSDRLLDNGFRAVGIPSGAPVIRALP